ncbi:GNAT family N-acetyltransferase [Yoonia sp. 208BN28-4]|uniref:GNAT family N-acetyltransferase n=1 Tax=Yoonia sp. 208BN28-4 TaxID=3126505 RepID=UPI0030A313CD
MSEPDVQHEASDSKGRYFIDHGNGASELTYSRLSALTVIADHTEVAEGHEGTGVGLRLLEALLADARKHGFRIVPLCPFVNAQRRKHPEWAMLFNV